MWFWRPIQYLEVKINTEPAHSHVASSNLKELVYFSMVSIKGFCTTAWLDLLNALKVIRRKGFYKIIILKVPDKDAKTLICAMIQLLNLKQAQAGTVPFSETHTSFPKIYDRWETSRQMLWPLYAVGWNGFKTASHSRIISADIDLSEGKIWSLKLLVGKNTKILHTVLNGCQRS